MAAVMTVAFLLGLLLVAVGCWLIYRPAGLIVAGASLIAVVVLWVRGSWASSTK